jgi:succinate dehydrogenase / fumarate reductase cytochrome b subunit
MNLQKYIGSSIGKKQIVAVSGVALVLFLIAHLIGNLLIFKGPETFNAYAAALHSMGKFLLVLEAGLFTTFALHIVFTVALIIENKKARGQAYQVSDSDRSFATRTMRYTGPLVFFFLFLHLSDFVFKGAAETNPLGTYGMVVDTLHNPIHAAIYIAAMLSIGFHLAHGIQSVFQSFGVVGAGKSKNLKLASNLIGALVSIGFSSIPLYINFIL